MARGLGASVEAVSLLAVVEYQQAGQALVSFAYVRKRSARTTEDGQPRSQTVLTYPGPSRADLESVWACASASQAAE
jgi:hypothetical protein